MWSGQWERASRGPGTMECPVLVQMLAPLGVWYSESTAHWERGGWWELGALCVSQPLQISTQFCQIWNSSSAVALFVTGLQKWKAPLKSSPSMNLSTVSRFIHLQCKVVIWSLSCSSISFDLPRDSSTEEWPLVCWLVPHQSSAAGSINSSAIMWSFLHWATLYASL